MNMGKVALRALLSVGLLFASCMPAASEARFAVCMVLSAGSTQFHTPIMRNDDQNAVVKESDAMPSFVRRAFGGSVSNETVCLYDSSWRGMRDRFESSQYASRVWGWTYKEFDWVPVGWTKATEANSTSRPSPPPTAAIVIRDPEQPKAMPRDPRDEQRRLANEEWERSEKARLAAQSKKLASEVATAKDLARTDRERRLATCAASGISKGQCPMPARKE